MTSMLLHLWLMTASAAAAAGLEPPSLNGTVEVPAAPSPSAPPLPTGPVFPARPSVKAPGASGSSNRAPAPEAASARKPTAGATRFLPQKVEANSSVPAASLPPRAQKWATDSSKPAASSSPPAQKKAADSGKPAASPSPPTPTKAADSAKPAASSPPAIGKSARPAAPVKRSPQPVLPTLSTTALKSELHQSLVVPKEAAGPVSDRARLEQLTFEIAHAREALRQETARLEALIKQSGPADGGAGSPPSESSPAPEAAAAPAKDTAREQLDSVSKALKGMKPEQAAAVLSLLDRRLAAQVLRNMRPADAGAVMGFLKPEQAADLATEIATRKPTSAKKGRIP